MDKYIITFTTVILLLLGVISIAFITKAVKEKLDKKSIFIALFTLAFSLYTAMVHIPTTLANDDTYELTKTGQIVGQDGASIKLEEGRVVSLYVDDDIGIRNEKFSVKRVELKQTEDDFSLLTYENEFGYVKHVINFPEAYKDTIEIEGVLK